MSKNYNRRNKYVKYCSKIGRKIHMHNSCRKFKAVPELILNDDQKICWNCEHWGEKQ